MSFYTSLSGLQAAQTELSAVSHNLANVSTNGFKKSRTDFADVIASSISTDPTKIVGSGVVVKANKQQFTEGNLKTTGAALDLTVAGDGFFAVKTSGLNTSTAYTRNGAFQIDPTTHNIVDAQGSTLLGYPVDAKGNVTASGADGLVPINLPQTSGTPAPTGNVALKVNLYAAASVPTTTFDPANASSYNSSTTSTIYDSSGKASTLTNYYVHTGTDAWTVHSFVGDKELSVGGSTTGTPVTFDASGKITAPTTPVSYDAFTPTTGGVSQTLKFDLSGSTQNSTAFSVNARSSDGSSVGDLSGVTVNSEGMVTATYSNGDTTALGKVALANFSNPAGLRQDGDSYWSASGVSGQASLGSAKENGFGSLLSGTLEGSNVDITEELVALIAAQRNFQANSKALDTSNQITQTIVNLRA
ncbi:flagellar hook protein FlgE [Sphingomonas sp. BE270]|jgi:flagellar hook protein FlgE|uniref:flagellar hook protein FlgE n=1 Tax=unclassified Sphingomonas TaxID=196159 RepID=UPI00053D8C04|nr:MULTISPECIES: flagellar hook protein FlgE [unclassified Sphingomonas]MDR6848021.1 flagellar hook protein FlgE [Sphingomonas sp. BE137]MDR7258299.1 flagellar hook protein FlgE [Sphingomonas sp. BE270]